MKLWQKGEEIDKLFERFTIGDDPILDLEIAFYDVLASKTHARMLGKIGLLTGEEVEQLERGLDSLQAKIEKGQFTIEEGIEDCHSQIELELTRMLGEVGKKIHAGRSRNDQVLTALKLFTKDELKLIAKGIDQFFELLLEKSEANKDVLMPGYTHMQVAMPSSFGMWFGSYAESLTDDLILLKAAYEIADKNPLGSAAGYGASFPLDRDFTTKDLGFAHVNVNSAYAQMTRGKMEKVAGYAIAALASTLSKFAMDVCLYAGQNYGFFSFSPKYTTGSSIMPHKHNPDGFELVRAKCNKLQALPTELSFILTNLPGGYHRDLQVLKEHFIPSMKIVRDCLEVTYYMTKDLTVNDSIINDPKYSLLFTVEEVNKLVLAGTPFRDAYRQVAEKIGSGSYQPDYQLRHTHLGSIGNLGNDRIKAAFEEVYKFFK